MRLDDRALHAQQRRAADLGGIEAPFECAEGILRQQRGDLALHGAHELLLDHPKEQRHHALRVLEQHIAREAVRRQHIAAAGERVARLDVAAELKGLLLRHQLVGLLRLLVALGRLRADVEQADLRLFHVHHAAHVGAAHQAKLHDPLGLAVHIRAGVHHQQRTARHGQQRRQRGASDALDAPELEHRARHQRAGRAGGDERVRLLPAHHVHAHAEVGVLLPAQRHDRMLLRGDDLRRIHDGQAGLHLPVALLVRAGGERLLEHLLRADKRNLHIVKLAQRGNRAIHVDLRRVIAAHAVKHNLHRISSLRPFDSCRGLRPSSGRARSFEQQCRLRKGVHPDARRDGEIQRIDFPAVRDERADAQRRKAVRQAARLVAEDE